MYNVIHSDLNLCNSLMYAHTQSVRVNSNTTYWIAIATIILSPSIDNERFQCFVSIGEQTTSHQVLLRVDPEGKVMRMPLLYLLNHPNAD